MTLEVLTRHLPARATLLARQQASLATLVGAWRQTILVDPIGLGIGASHLRLRTVEPSGDWVWMLDDDDEAADPHLIQRLDRRAELHVFRMAYDWGVLPEDEAFEQHFIHEQHIGAPCVVVSRGLWMRARKGWTDRYEGDYDFIRTAVGLAEGIRWHDVVVAKIDQARHGAVEVA